MVPADLGPDLVVEDLRAESDAAQVFPHFVGTPGLRPHAALGEIDPEQLARVSPRRGHGGSGLLRRTPGSSSWAHGCSRSIGGVGAASADHDRVRQLRRARGAPEHRLGQEARGGPRGEERRLDVEGIALEMRLPVRQVHAGNGFGEGHGKVHTGCVAGVMSIEAPA